MNKLFENLTASLKTIDNFIWGPAMLILLTGTGIFLTFRTKALCIRNLPYALKIALNKEARQKSGDGDVSPFSALATALASTIGTGNIVGVATAMVSGGPGALVWMWLSAVLGLTTKFSECMLAIKYREKNKNGEMTGGPMYTIKNTFKNKQIGAVLSWLFALFALIASFGIGNLTQANSIAASINNAFSISYNTTGIVITVLSLFIILKGIKSISKVSQIIVPVMAVFYIIAGLIVIAGNIRNLPSGIAEIFKMAFSQKAINGGIYGNITASMTHAMRFGIARGVFSNEAGIGSAAITSAAASTDNPVKQGYINMTGTFWDTIVICTITGLCIACSGVLGSADTKSVGTYFYSPDTSTISICADKKAVTYHISTTNKENSANMTLRSNYNDTDITLYPDKSIKTLPIGIWKDSSGNIYIFRKNNSYEYKELTTGSDLTIKAFKTILGDTGSKLICISIVLFAFSTIIGWEYNGEKALEYLLGTYKYNIFYRIFFSLIAYAGATTTLEIAWIFSDIANALMAIPNLICLLVLNNIIVKEINLFESGLRK